MTIVCRARFDFGYITSTNLCLSNIMMALELSICS